MTKNKKSFADNLGDLIPKNKLANYVSREVADGQTEFDIFAYALENKQNTLIEGDTGCGKTYAVMAHAEKMQMPFFSVACNGATNPDQLIGTWLPKADGGIEWVDGVITTFVRNGGVLLLDEVNFMKPDISAAFHSLLDDRRTLNLIENGGEVIKAADTFQVIATYNRNYAGTREINEAFKNRFAHKPEFTYEQLDEDTLTGGGQYALLNLAEQLRQARADGIIHTPISTNSLMLFCDFIEDMSLEYALTNFINQFNDDERSSIKEIFDIFIPQIAGDLGVDVPEMFVVETTQADIDDATDKS